MSGHSKWANIKRHKAVVDAKKGAVYAKMAREIIVAAKMGGADPAGNFRLRTAIEKARAEGVPNDNIQRAIEKGAGGGGADSIEELTYEGYGPGGVAVLVRCATDNRNRTAGDIRSYFSKCGGNMGETGCVSWMFKEQGEVFINRPVKTSDDDLMLLAIDLGAEDIDTNSEEYIRIVCDSASLEGLREGLSKAGIKPESSEVVMTPSSSIEIQDKEQAKQLIKMLDLIENHDDVQQVHANFEMDNAWLEELV